IDPQGLLQRRRGVQLDDEPPFLDQRIAHGVLERCRVHLDFVAGTALRRILMALTAAGRVEQRAEPRLRGEVAVEYDLPLGEAIPLRAVQAAERIAGLEGPLAAGREQHECHDRAGAPRGHGARTVLRWERAGRRRAQLRGPDASYVPPGGGYPAAFYAVTRAPVNGAASRRELLQLLRRPVDDVRLGAERAGETRHLIVRF